MWLRTSGGGTYPQLEQLRSEAAKQKTTQRCIGAIKHSLLQQFRLVKFNQNNLSDKVFSPFTSHYSQKNVAFTLAEVLVTLGIIGVVAALTMPSLIVKHQKLQTVTRFKKAYSELSQAIRISENKYGLLESWDFSNFETPAERANYFYENYLNPNLKIVKKCKPENQSECWADKVYNLDGDLKQDNEFAADGNRLTFITASGMSYLYWLHGVGTGGWFWVDINGPKKGPNTLGKDIFPIVAHWGYTVRMSVEDRCTPKRGVFPYGLHCMQAHTRTEIKNGFEVGGIFSYCCLKGSGKRNAGTNCGAIIMYDSWQIADDYPW